MSDVVFRRIRGHIVPIKLTKEQKGQVKGLGIAAAGAVVAAEGGALYKRLAFKATQTAIKGMKDIVPSTKEFTGIKNKFKSTAQMSFDDIVQKTSPRISEGSLKAAQRIVKSANFVKKASPFIGGALIAYGTGKFVSNYQKDKKKKVSPEIAGIIGLSAGTGGAAAAIKAKQIFEAGVAGRQQVFKFASSGIVSKLKEVGKHLFKGL